jgi:hypothetical protein
MHLSQLMSLVLPVLQDPLFSAGVPCCCSAAFLKERLFDQSDAYRVHVCEKSGLIAVANLKKQIFSSQIYKSDSQIVQVRWADVARPDFACS